jgi:hypothetical protein
MGLTIGAGHGMEGIQGHTVAVTIQAKKPPKPNLALDLP